MMVLYNMVDVHVLRQVIRCHICDLIWTVFVALFQGIF